MIDKIEKKIEEQQDELDYISQELNDLDEPLPSHRARWYEDRIKELLAKIEVLTELKISLM